MVTLFVWAGKAAWGHTSPSPWQLRFPEGEEDLSPREAGGLQTPAWQLEAIRGLAESLPESKEDFVEKSK